MKSIAVLSNHKNTELVSDLSSRLSAAGFRVNVFVFSTDTYESGVDLRSIEEHSAIVAVIKEPSHDLFLHLAYLIARDKDIWLLSNNVNNLPAILRRTRFIRLGEENRTDRLIAQLRLRLNVQTPKYETSGDPASFLTWLRQDIGRLSNLSSRDFERLVSIIFTQAGLSQRKETDTPEGDLILTTPDERTRLLVECMSYSEGQRVGIGEISRAMSNAMSLACDFTLLVSANMFTEAATNYAKSCAPPVWLLERDTLESMIRMRFESSSGTLGSVPGIFRKIMSAKTNVPEHNAMNFSDFGNFRPKIHPVGETLLAPTRLPYRWNQKLLHGHSTLPEKCELFISFAKGDDEPSEGLYRKMRKFIKKLIAEDIEVWHDSPRLEAGQRCRHLNEVASAVRRSNYVVYFSPHGFHHSISSAKILQTLATELARSPEYVSKLFVVGDDDVWSKLRLPAMFFDSTFLNTSDASWEFVVLDACRKVSGTEEKSSHLERKPNKSKRGGKTKM